MEIYDLWCSLREWVFPDVSTVEPPYWASDLINEFTIAGLYADTPWTQLTVLQAPITFQAEDPTFDRLRQAYQDHLHKWGQVYWELTHRLPLPQGPVYSRMSTAVKNRRSHAGESFRDDVLPLIVDLFRQGRADMDLLLDPMFLRFPRRRLYLTWYPQTDVAPEDRSTDQTRLDCLRQALRQVDEADPWRVFYRRAGIVDDEHPAHDLTRLQDKFVLTSDDGE